jgi:hypothetical protein
MYDNVPYVIVTLQSFEYPPVPQALSVTSPLVRGPKATIEACRVTHTNVCQTEQMPFLHRNSFVVVSANRGSILRNTLFVVAAVGRGRSGGNYGIETENRLTFAVFRRSGLSPIGVRKTIADFDVRETGNLDAATTSAAN